MSAVTPITLGFVPDPHGHLPPPPLIEAGIEAPDGIFTYVWLLDSGASRSCLPADSIEEIGVDQGELARVSVETGAGWRAALELPTDTFLHVVVGDDLRIPIAPFFLLNTDPSEESEFEDAEMILGRDFFFSFAEVAFSQAKQEVHLRL